MKKQFLLMMAGLVGVASSSYAGYTDGDVIQTNTTTCRVIGENLLTNGDFSNGLDGWTNLTLKPINSDSIKVYTDEYSPEEGMPYIQIALSDGVKGSNYIQTSNFRRSYHLEPGAYLITYKAKLMTSGVNSASRGSRNDNYQDVYINRDGECPYPNEDEDNKIRGSISEYNYFNAGEWKTVNYYYKTDTAAYVNFELYNLQQYDCFADFGVYPAEECGDARYLEDAISTLQSIIKDTEHFPGAAEALEGGLAELVSYNTPDQYGFMGPTDLNDVVEGIMGEDGPLMEYLNSISADVSSYFSESYFNFNDAEVKGVNKGAADDWSVTGGRWGVSAPWANLTTNHIFAEINSSYTLDAGSEYISALLPKGQYFYMVKGSAMQFYPSGSIPDYNTSRKGVGFFINADSVEMENISPSYAKTYWNVFNVAEDGEQTVGFWRYESDKANGADRARTSGGGRVRFDNMAIRILGITDADVKQFFLNQSLAESQNALKVMIDSAKTVVEDSRYLFGKDVLRDSIAVSQAVYDQNTEATQECIDILDKQMPFMRNAINAYYTINAEYVQLGDDIALAKSLVADEQRPNGRDALNAAIKPAETYYNAQTASTRDSLTLVKTDSTLMVAVQEFYYANATYNTPADVQLVNAEFTDGTNGWTVDGVGGNGAWKASSAIDTKTFGKLPGIYYNRGSGASDNKSVWQDVAITKTGAYDFQVILAVHHSSWSDLEQTTSTYLFANEDSMQVITLGPGEGGQVCGSFDKFNITTNVSSLGSDCLANPGFLRVGLEKHPLLDGTSIKVNMIYFVQPKLYYYGSWEEYLTGVHDVEVVDTTFDVYNLSGMKVRSGVNSLEGLPKGIYIVNGKKYVVK